MPNKSVGWETKSLPVLIRTEHYFKTFFNIHISRGRGPRYQSIKKLKIIDTFNERITLHINTSIWEYDRILRYIHEAYQKVKCKA